LFSHIRKLEAGHRIAIELDQPRVASTRFWDIPLDGETDALDFEDWTDRLDEKIVDSVRQQLIADVPLGAFLSGGVDSSLVVAAMGEAETFSIGFDDPSYNELEYSREVASHLGVDHKTQVIKPQVADLFDRLMLQMDDPIGDFSIFPTFLVSRLAREHVTVSLSGDGGDELFGGYETYLANDLATAYSRVPQVVRNGLIEFVLDQMKPRPEKKGLINKAKRFIEGFHQPGAMGHARWRIFLSETMRAGFFSSDIATAMDRPAGAHIESLFDRAKNLSPLNQCLYVDTRSYLLDNCLVKTDRMSMAVSLEARVPLLDYELVELAFRVPDEIKIRRRETKAVLKHIAARKIPRHCAYRPKEGFSIPIKHWLGTQFRPLLEDATSRSRIEGDGIFDFSVIDNLKNEHLSGRANHSHLLWSLIVFDRWKSTWLEGTA
jgi:asparagine synthase (glutamine-hydrolysing)